MISLALATLLAASAEPAPLIVNEPSEHYFLACTPLKDAAEPDDFASLWAFRFPTGIDLSERGVERYVDALAGGKLTHLFINVNYQRSYFPSKTIEPVWTSLDEPDSKPAWFYRDMRDAFARGLDVYAVMIRRCRERKVSPWISFRMNDIHGVAKETPADVCAFWREHPEYHLQPNEKWNWSNGFDYAQKPVRDRMSAYIREALERYDADGVELDFLRFPNYFREGEGRKNAPILTDFVREIRATCEAAAKRRGHPVKIAVRMTHELENALASGMDPATWSREGLIDMLIVCNMFGSIEYDYSLDAWRKLTGSKVTLVAGTDNGIRINERRRVLNLAEYRQWMETMRQKGADGSYLFNFTLRSFRDETWRGVVGEASPASAAVADVPFCALRFGYRYSQPDKWPEMRSALEKNRGAFDEVWFSTGITFPSLAWHEEHARQCAAVADDLRKLGIVPSIEFQTIIGHGDEFMCAGDCSGQDWGTMVSADGLAAKRLSCPRDPRLAAYFTRVAEMHAAWKPGSMWIDDDFSLRNRVPLKKPENYLTGCFCDRCIDLFAKQDGRRWTREELTTAIRADADVRKRWEDYSWNGLRALARTIAATVRRLSPETVMGYQYGPLDERIPLGLAEGSGRPVRLRPGAGAYWDGNAHQQVYKAYQLQESVCDIRRHDWVGACCPEIESCPRTFGCRTAQGIILEAFENLALGMDFLSMFVADARTDESTAFYADRLFPRLQAAHPFLKGYRDANLGTQPCGFTVLGGCPAEFVACRGVPIVGRNGRSLGELPDVASIKIRMAGSGEVDSRSSEYQTRVMQIASTTGLTNFYARCDAASGGRLPVVFEEAVMAFAIPRVRTDGTLVTLALVNASIDRQDPVIVRLRGVPAQVTAAVWHGPEENPIECPIERRGAEVRVRLPRIGAWGCGYLDVRSNTR